METQNGEHDFGEVRSNFDQTRFEAMVLVNSGEMSISPDLGP